MPKQPTTQGDETRSEQQASAATSHAVAVPVKPHIQTSKPGNAGDKSEGSDTIAKPWVSGLRYWSPTLLNVLVVAALIFHGIQFQRQWQAMKTSIAETKTSRELEYRAYVAVKAVKFEPLANNPAWGQVSVTLSNTGRTPGLEGTIRSNVEARETTVPEHQVLNPPDHPGSKVVFAPTVEIQQSVGLIKTGFADIVAKGEPSAAGKSEPVATPNVQAMLEPPEPVRSPKGFYIYGLVEYKDIFQQQHWTKFCFVNTPGTQNWKHCQTYNDAN